MKEWMSGRMNLQSAIHLFPHKCNISQVMFSCSQSSTGKRRLVVRELPCDMTWSAGCSIKSRTTQCQWTLLILLQQPHRCQQSVDIHVFLLTVPPDPRHCLWKKWRMLRQPAEKDRYLGTIGQPGSMPAAEQGKESPRPGRAAEMEPTG